MDFSYHHIANIIETSLHMAANKMLRLGEIIDKAKCLCHTHLSLQRVMPFPVQAFAVVQRQGASSIGRSCVSMHEAHAACLPRDTARFRESTLAHMNLQTDLSCHSLNLLVL